MMQNFEPCNSCIHTVIKRAQLDEIVAAIIAGKYSWACFLLLRCAGYNPLDYIPYRTYNRLLKENCMSGKSINPKVCSLAKMNRCPEPRSVLSKNSERDYLEVVRDQPIMAEPRDRPQKLSEWTPRTTNFVSPSEEVEENLKK